MASQSVEKVRANTALIVQKTNEGIRMYARLYVLDEVSIAANPPKAAKRKNSTKRQAIILASTATVVVVMIANSLL